jgi:nucleotide-binding universal stress UspA family protein
VAHLATRGVTAQHLRPAGDPAPTIERIPREGSYDTVVMGTAGVGAATRLLQGSVSEYVVAHSQAHVVIVH